MSRAIPANLLAHLRGERQTTAMLWRIQKNDGSEIRGTDHDDDITIPGSGNDAAGTYLAASSITGTQMRSTADFGVDNMDVSGAMPSDTRRVDVNRDEIEAGLFRDAAVWIYVCNWARPEDGVATIKRGMLGEIVRDTDGAYSTEIRGLTETLRQLIIRTYSERCQVRDFGDSECGLDVVALQQTGTITTVASRRRFTASLTGGQAAGYFSLGEITFTSGLNSGFTREIKRDDEGDVVGDISLWDTLPDTVQVGDTFNIRPGCNRAASTCRAFGNILNFRGYGIYIEGLDALMAGPTRGTSPSLADLAGDLIP